MKNYSDLCIQSMMDGYKGQPIVILVHDKEEIGFEIGGRLYEQGFFPMIFGRGEDVLKKMDEDPTLITNAIAIIIHKDLGQHRLSISSIELVQKIREFPGGKEIRTGLVSGEFSYKGVSDTAREVIGADFGYDPTDGFVGILPEWVVSQIKLLGRLSPQEIAECRYKETVIDRGGAELRFTRFSPTVSAREKI